MENLGYYNGKIGLIDEMTVPMNDRACWFGDGVYDAGPCHNYSVFAIDEHIDRFYRNAEKLDIQIPLDKAEFKELLINLVKRLDTGDLFVYYQVTRGTAMRNHTYVPGKGNLWVMIIPAGINDGQEPVSLITVPDTRFYHCDIKTLNLIPSVMASQKAMKAGCYEAVFYRPGGRVTECAHSNVHILKNGALITAPADNLILPGIARAHLINACKELNIDVYEKINFLQDLKDADEIIVTSSSSPCLRADKIDGENAGYKDSDLFEKLRKYLLNEFYEETEII